MSVSHAGTYRDSMPHSWPSAGLRHPTVPLAQCQKSKKPHWVAFTLLILLGFWCRRDESNTRPSHYE